MQLKLAKRNTSIEIIPQEKLIVTRLCKFDRIVPKFVWNKIGYIILQLSINSNILFGSVDVEVRTLLNVFDAFVSLTLIILQDHKLKSSRAQWLEQDQPKDH